MQILEIDRIPKEVKRVVVGFPGTGMVGAIALEFIIKKTSPRLIAYFLSEKLPAVAIIRKSGIEAPIRAYLLGDTLFVVSDIMVPDDACWEIAEALAGWIQKLKPEEVIIVGGAGKSPAGEKKVYVVSWKRKYLDTVEDAEHMKLGFVVSIYSTLSFELMKRGIDGFLLLAEADSKPDPRMAARLIRILNKIIGLDVDPEPLEREAERKVVKGKTWDPYPSIYA